MINPMSTPCRLMKFAGIHHKHEKAAVEHTVLASVQAFHFLHRVRFGGLPEPMKSDPDPDHSDSDVDPVKEGIRPWCPPRYDDTQDRANLNALGAESGEARCTHKRACRRPAGQFEAAHTPTTRAATPLSASNDTGGPTSSICPGTIRSDRNNRRHTTARRTNFKKAATEGRTTVRAKAPRTPALCAEPSRQGGRQRLTQRCRERLTIPRTAVPSPGATEPQTAEQIQPATSELPLAVLWTRWRQAEPRHGGGPAEEAAAQRRRLTSKEKFPREWERSKGEGDP